MDTNSSTIRIFGESPQTPEKNGGTQRAKITARAAKGSARALPSIALRSAGLLEALGAEELDVPELEPLFVPDEPGAVAEGDTLDEVAVPFKRSALRYANRQVSSEFNLPRTTRKRGKAVLTAKPNNVSVELSLALITPTPPSKHVELS